MSAPGRGRIGSSYRALSRSRIRRWASRGILSSWRVAVRERRILRFVKRDELLGLEDALFPLVQEPSLRVLDEAAQQVVVRLSLASQPLQVVAVLFRDGDRRQAYRRLSGIITIFSFIEQEAY